jgi:glycosyltransferase involved in cell wall biosynthesis
MSPASRRRVAILATWYPTASRPGSGVFVREQARALAAVADVVVIYPDPDDHRARRGAWMIEDALEDGLRTIRVHIARPRIPGARLVLFAAAVRSALRRLAREDWIPDVLHAHGVGPALFALPARRRRVPLVVTEHYSGFALGTVTGISLWLARFTFARADLVCPVSENLAGHLRRLGVKARVLVMPNAIDTRRFYPKPERRHGGPVRALLVARLTEVKQVPVLLDALALARSRPGAPEILLDVAGDGPLLEELRQRADALGLGAAVRWLGRRSGAKVADLMRESDLVVLSSRWENLPVVLQEAMASGLPVVAPAVGGVREIVDDDSGAVVPSGDVTALADAMIGVASRLPAYDRAALQARAVERYGFEAVTNRWLRVYDELIAARA